jgi:hypothetical protein
LLYTLSCWLGPGLENVVKLSGSDANELEGIAITAHMLVSHTHKQELHAFLGKIVWVSSLVILVATAGSCCCDQCPD